MSKELEALERYKYLPTKIDYDIIENALKDYEWLKSIIPIDAMFMWNLSSDDKLRLLKVMGLKL